jgi:hypothetical protein
MSCVLDSLEREWRRLERCSSGRRAALRWGVVHAALRGVGSLGELLERRRDSSGAPAVLAALAVLAPTDDLAARTLLQALLPGLVRLAATAGYDDPEAVDELVSLAWERIRTYPAGRAGSVAGNIMLDVRKKYSQQRFESATMLSLGWRHRLDVRPWAELRGEAAGMARPAEDEALERLTLEQVAAQRAVVGDVCFRAVSRTLGLGLSLAEAAAEENVTVPTLTQRRWRALQQMRQLPLAG